MKDQNQNTMPDSTCRRGNHAAIHEDIMLQQGRVSTDEPDEPVEEYPTSLPVTINGKINGHGPYDYI